MSELRSRIDSAWKDAMRARDTLRRDTLNTLRATIKSAEIELRTGGSSGEGALDEAAVQRAIEREAKKRRDAAEEYEKLDRPERAATERAELAVLQEFLPAELTDEELETLAADVKIEGGYTSAKEMGAFMKALMPRVEGRADGKRVNAIVRRLLS